MPDTTATTVKQTATLGVDVSAGTGTAIDASKTMVVTPAGPLEEMAILIWNTEGSTNAVTFKASSDPSSQSRGVGDTTITLAATTGAQLAPVLESARFIQHDGTLQITFEAGTTGYVLPIQMKRI